MGRDEGCLCREAERIVSKAKLRETGCDVRGGRVIEMDQLHCLISIAAQRARAKASARGSSSGYQVTATMICAGLPRLRQASEAGPQPKLHPGSLLETAFQPVTY